jgi:hypothetical protein
MRPGCEMEYTRGARSRIHETPTRTDRTLSPSQTLSRHDKLCILMCANGYASRRASHHIAQREDVEQTMARPHRPIARTGSGVGVQECRTHNDDGHLVTLVSGSVTHGCSGPCSPSDPHWYIGMLRLGTADAPLDCVMTVAEVEETEAAGAVAQGRKARCRGVGWRHNTYLYQHDM